MKRMKNEDLRVLAAMENMEGFRLIDAEEAMAVNGGCSSDEEHRRENESLYNRPRPEAC
jgi:hypothetical protein